MGPLAAFCSSLPIFPDRSLCPFMHRYSVPCSHSWKSRGVCGGNDKQFVFIAAEPKVGIPVINHQLGGGLSSSTPGHPPRTPDAALFPPEDRSRLPHLMQTGGFQDPELCHREGVGGLPLCPLSWLLPLLPGFLESCPNLIGLRSQANRAGDAEAQTEV